MIQNTNIDKKEIFVSNIFNNLYSRHLVRYIVYHFNFSIVKNQPVFLVYRWKFILSDYGKYFLFT